MRLRRALIIPDCHVPYHNRKAFSLMLEASGKVDEVVLLGDFADIYNASSHVRDPRLSQFLIDEIAAVNAAMDLIEKAHPKAKKVFLEGNHEYRLQRYIFQHAPALFGLTQLQDLFQIGSRPSWSWLPYQRDQAYKILGSDLYARHTPLASNAKSGLQRAFVSYIHGHTHQISEAQAVGLDQKVRVALCPGWLGDSRLKAFDYLASPAQWQLGFAIVSVEGSSKTFHHELIQIKENYTCVVNGKRFKA